MRTERLHPALVLCSSSLRARQTLEAIQPALGKGCRIEFAPELYAAPEEVLLAQLRALPESVRCVLFIGHNPGLQDLALSLVSSGADLARLKEKFPTCGLAAIALKNPSWSALKPGDGELVRYVVPRELD